MVVSLIAAVSENGVIGRDADVPWRQREDLRRFKRMTTGHTVIMGRKTFESIGETPLPGRRNIVVSRRAGYERPGVEAAGSVEAAIEMAGGEDLVYVVGGGEIYTLALPHADRLDLTIIHTEIDGGDAFFPEFDGAAWRLVEDERHEADERNEFAYSFRVYVRSDAGAGAGAED